jgi:hypothetical protein
MSIIDRTKAHPVGILTDGNNFWQRFQTVTKTPGSYGIIQSTGSRGGGNGGNFTEYFIILNASREPDIDASLAQQNLTWVRSALPQGASVHESTLKGILAFAKKGDKQIVDLGGGLVLGQIDNMKSAFSHLLEPQDAKPRPMAAPGKDGLYDDVSGLGTTNWATLFEDVGAILRTHQDNTLVQLTGAPGSGLGILVARVRGPQPKQKISTSVHGFPNIQARLKKAIGQLGRSEYVRVELQNHQRDIYFGSLQALAGLRESAIQQAAEVPAQKDGAPTNGLSQTQALYTPVTQSAPRNPPAPPPPTPTTGSSNVIDASGMLHDEVTQVIGWGEVRQRFVDTKEFVDENGFCFLTIRDAPVGLAVSMDFVDGCNTSMIESVRYLSSAFTQNPKRALTVLEDGKAIRLMTRDTVSMIIYPVTCVPEDLVRKLPVPSPTPAPAPEPEEPAIPKAAKSSKDYDVVSITPLSWSATPDEQRVSLKPVSPKRLAVILASLNESDHAIGIKIGADVIHTTSNPEVVRTAGSLARRFDLEARVVGGPASPDQAAKGWAAAFQEATLFDGLVIYAPPFERPVVMTRNPNLFSEPNHAP